MQTEVIIALGSNRRHNRHGAPWRVVAAAIDAIDARDIAVVRRSQIHATAPVGPSSRRFANAVVVARTALSPPALLAALKDIERDFGRRRGRRWAARVLDLDIIAYDSVILPSRPGWAMGRGLVIPHRALHQRRFVLDPLLEVAPGWRHPVLALTVRQLHTRSRR